MKIGTIDLGERPVSLAPMEDVTDLAFRLLCKRMGADMVYTEFVSSDALVRHVGKTVAKLNIDACERPTAVQIYGRDAGAMAEAAQMCQEAGGDIVDLNFGCPVKKIAGKGAGAGLLRDIPLLLEITRRVVEAVRIPVTVKTRLGWDDANRCIVELAERLQDCGVAALSIHGRTRAQMYTGDADWTLIGAVKANPRMSIPIVGNGDVDSPERCAECFDRYGVDGVMIGRGSIGRPWIFREIKHFLKHGERLPSEAVEWYLDVLKGQAAESIRRSDERRGILHIRRHLAATPLFKGIADFKPTRVAMLRAETAANLYRIMDEASRLVERGAI